jgi:tyrosyl-DNA phosphodiesterase-1
VDPRSGDDANGAEEDPMARSRVMPHVKTFARYRPEDASVAWVILGSHNLSGAAWGRLEKNGAQVNILSYELSVLLEPNAIGPRVPTPFTLTAAPSDASAAPGAPPRLARCLCLASARPRVDANAASANVLESTRPVEIRPARRLPGDDERDDAEAAEAAADPRGKGRGDVAWAPFPFPLPPPPYAPGDTPWAVNGACDVPDAFGRVMRGGCVEMSPEEVGGATRSNRD